MWCGRRRRRRRRARAKMRRYCAANRLNRFATLTYAGEGCFDHGELRADVAGFFRGLRARAGRRAAAVSVGAGVASRRPRAARPFRGRAVRQAESDRGCVGRAAASHIKLIGDLPVGSGALEEARLAARYLAKYVSKNVADERVPRLHRYEVAQGFQPRAGAAEGHLGGGRIGQASEMMGGEPPRVWRRRSRRGGRRRPPIGMPGLADDLRAAAHAPGPRQTAQAQGLGPRSRR